MLLDSVAGTAFLMMTQAHTLNMCVCIMKSLKAIRTSRYIWDLETAIFYTNY